MVTCRRRLDAVTPRRVVAFLLVAGFAQEILSPGWARSPGGWTTSRLWRACLEATVKLALDAGLIYLGLRGLGSRWRLRRPDRYPIATAEPGARPYGPPGSAGGARSEDAGRSQEGGGDDRGHH